MPPIDYAQLATKQDLNALNALSTELRGEMAGLRGDFAGLKGDFATLEARVGFASAEGEMAELRGDFKSDSASNLRYVVAGQITTTMMLGAWVIAVT